MYGSYRIEFFPAQGYPNLSEYFVDNDTPLSSFQTVFTGNLDASAHFSQTGIVNNNRITPVGSKWRIYICPLATSECGVFDMAVTADADITALINANIQAPRFPAIYGNYGYNDLEAQIQSTPSSWYYNVVLLCLRTYNYQTLAWNCATTATIVQPFPGAIGATFDGGQNVPNTSLPLIRYITLPFNATITNWTLVGDSIGDCSIDLWFIPGSAPPAAPSIPLVGNKISAAAPISMTGVQSKSGDATAIATWSKSITKWGTLAFVMTSVNFVHTISVEIQVSRS